MFSVKKLFKPMSLISFFVINPENKFLTYYRVHYMKYTCFLRVVRYVTRMLMYSFGIYCSFGWFMMFPNIDLLSNVWCYFSFSRLWHKASVS